MSEDVRTRLLRHGIILFQEQGFHATGIHQIAVAAGIPKGSFCYYFRSKNAFAEAVINRYASEIEAGIHEYFAMVELPPLVRLRAYFDNALASMKIGVSHGCAIGNLLAEIGETNDVLQAALHEAWEMMVMGLKPFLVQAQQAGDLSTTQDLHRLAELLLSGWEGGLIAMRAQRSTRPLEDFLEFVATPLLSAGSNGSLTP